MCYLLQLVLKTKWYFIILIILCAVYSWLGTTTFIHNFYFVVGARLVDTLSFSHFECLSGAWSMMMAMAMVANCMHSLFSLISYTSAIYSQSHIHNNKYIVERFETYNATIEETAGSSDGSEPFLLSLNFHFWLFQCFIVASHRSHICTLYYWLLYKHTEQYRTYIAQHGWWCILLS